MLWTARSANSPRAWRSSSSCSARSCTNLDLLVLDELLFRPRSGQPGTARGADHRPARSRRDYPLLHPCHGPCRTAVRPAGDHRRRQAPLRRHRGAMPAACCRCAPIMCRTMTAPASPRLLPPDAERDADGWRFIVLANGGGGCACKRSIEAGLRHFRPVDGAARPARCVRAHRRTGRAEGQTRHRREDAEHEHRPQPPRQSAPPDPPDADHRTARFRRHRLHADVPGVPVHPRC